MFDPSAHHSEPFGEASSYSSQRAAQMVSLVAAAAEVALRRRALHAARQATRDEQKRRMLQTQESAFRAQARAGWAPALDARWLAQADLLQAGRAWGAAVPWADNDPEAAAALRRAEERLRTLHPYAMDRYDRLRSEGASPLDAMREAAHLFGREPHARPGQPAPGHLAVEAGPPASEPVAASGTPVQPDSGLDPHQEAEHRGRSIVERLQARALHKRGAQLSPDELATTLEASTSLPAEVIARLAHAEAAGAHASADRTATQLAAESFPCTVADGIRAAVADRLQPTQSADRAASVQETRRISVSP